MIFHDPRSGLTISKATRATARQVGALLRPEDKREAEAISGMNAARFLARTYGLPQTETLVAFVGETPLAIFGTADLDADEGTGIIWMLGTTHLEKHKRALMRGARWWLPQVLSSYPGGVANVMSAENLLHIKFAARLGARFATNKLRQIGDLTFVPFIFKSE